MQTSIARSHQQADEALKTIADYVQDYAIVSAEAYQTARACLADSLGCAILALNFKECTKLLGPVVPGNHRPAWQPRSRHLVCARPHPRCL